MNVDLDYLSKYGQISITVNNLYNYNFQGIADIKSIDIFDISR